MLPPNSLLHWTLQWVLFSLLWHNFSLCVTTLDLKENKGDQAEQPIYQLGYLYTGYSYVPWDYTVSFRAAIHYNMLWGKILRQQNIIYYLLKISSKNSVQFSCSVVSDSLRPHELQHARPPCPSPSPGVHSNSRPSSRDAIQPSHPLSSPSPPAPNPSQHQSLFQWVSSLHEVAKVLEFQL